jgi:hypothetical protein
VLPGSLGLSKALEHFCGLLKGAALRLQSPFLLAVASLLGLVIRKDPMGQVVATKDLLLPQPRGAAPLRHRVRAGGDTMTYNGIAWQT